MENNNLATVQAALAGDPVETERLFNDRMTSEISDRVENARKEIASSILTTPQEPTADETGNE
jgi:hypothetical protein